MNKKEYDIVVIGGGLAGLAFACCVADRSLAVLVVEPNNGLPPEDWPVGFDHRVSALTHASENILRHVGAWPFIEGRRVSPFSRMEVWEGDGTGNIQFVEDDLGADYLGHIVENRVLIHGLSQRVRQLGNIGVICSSLRNLERLGAGWRITLDSGDVFEPSLVVGADGAKSRVRELAGFQTRQWGYGQTAIVTTVETELPHDSTARQNFLSTGPLAFLPLREHSGDTQSRFSSIVWSVEEDESRGLLALDEDVFCLKLGYALENRLGRVVAVDKRFSFPLEQSHAVDYVKPGLALVADAAHTIHPLAGQGINLGFLDTAVLAEEVLRGFGRGLGAGDPFSLRRYQRRRKGNNLGMMSVMEGFKRLYEQDKLPVRWVRNAGMSFLNRHRLIKNKVAMRAMGLEGDLPEAAKPNLIVDF